MSTVSDDTFIIAFTKMESFVKGMICKATWFTMTGELAKAKFIGFPAYVEELAASSRSYHLEELMLPYEHIDRGAFEVLMDLVKSCDRFGFYRTYMHGVVVFGAILSILLDFQRRLLLTESLEGIPLKFRLQFLYGDILGTANLIKLGNTPRSIRSALKKNLLKFESENIKRLKDVYKKAVIKKYVDKMNDQRTQEKELKDDDDGSIFRPEYIMPSLLRSEFIYLGEKDIEDGAHIDKLVAEQKIKNVQDENHDEDLEDDDLDHEDML